MDSMDNEIMRRIGEFLREWKNGAIIQRHDDELGWIDMFGTPYFEDIDKVRIRPDDFKDWYSICEFEDESGCLFIGAIRSNQPMGRRDAFIRKLLDPIEYVPMIGYEPQ